MQASYSLGFQNPGKKKLEFTLKNLTKNLIIQKTLTTLYLSNILGRIYEKIILQQVAKILEENNFFKGKNLCAYQKNKNTSQALLPLIEQMCEGVANGRYGIAVFGDLQGASDAVLRKGALYKLHKAGITNNLVSVFSSFLTDIFYRNLVNFQNSDWACTTTGVPQGFLLSPFIFLVFTADMTLEEPKQTPGIPTESKYADDFDLWRIGIDFYHLLIQIQIAIINLQTWCLNWQISINISKTNYIIFYDKKKLPPPASVRVTINGNSLMKFKAKRVLGIIINKDLTFTPYIEHCNENVKQHTTG